jgi:hypothetical protein
VPRRCHTFGHRITVEPQHLPQQKLCHSIPVRSSPGEPGALWYDR